MPSAVKWRQRGCLVEMGLADARVMSCSFLGTEGGTPPRRDENGAQQIDCKRDGALPLCRYGCKPLGAKEIRAMKETKELDELAGTDKFGGTGSDNSRPMVA